MTTVIENEHARKFWDTHCFDQREVPLSIAPAMFTPHHTSFAVMWSNVVRACERARARKHMYVYVHIYVNVYNFVYDVCVRAYVHVYVCIYIYI